MGAFPVCALDLLTGKDGVEYFNKI
jgi:hypothetical protein